MPTIREVKTELRHREWAKHLRKNSLTASCRGVKHCLKPATEHIIRLLKTRLRLVTASHPQYFIVTDSISPHSNSQQLTAIHCDEPNTGFEPRLISAHFVFRWGWVWLAVTIIVLFRTIIPCFFVSSRIILKKLRTFYIMPKLLVFSLTVYSETITAEIAFKTSPISFSSSVFI